MKIRLASEILKDSIVDGPGIRAVIWTQGCSHNCPGCHNPMTHDFNGGFLKDIDELKKEILSLELCDGITLSGGDPMFQIDACLEIAKYCKELNLNIWCYTGFTYEQLIDMSKNKKNIIELLNNIDVLVDGKFILSEKSMNFKFRGSKNQRLINVKESLKQNNVILYEEDIRIFDKYKKNKALYI